MEEKTIPKRTDKVILTPEDIVAEYRNIITSSLQNI